MEEKNGGVRRVTTLELLDAATWREIDSDGPQPPAAFLHALSCLPGRRFLIVPRRPQLMRSLWCARRGYMLCDTKMWKSTGLKMRFNIENMSDYGQVALKSENKALKGR
jgi:hypothetical protein